MTERLKILVVDDEQVILDSATRMLGSDRCQVLTALDAESAMDILRAEGPDILVSDLVLPGASGMELLESASEHDPSLVSIITTGYSTVENAVRAMKRGAFDFLPKPFTFEELLSSTSRAVRVIEQRLNLNAHDPVGGHQADFRLGTQSWVRAETEGTAVLGVTRFQLQTIDAIEKIDFPDVDAELRQGGRLVCLHTADELSHSIWSPLSGRVLAINDELLGSPDSLRADPSGAGWLLRVVPADLNGELVNLIGP
jgi:DNA-binding response OmpR family regulator